jgi:hypothetical protein
LRKKLPTNTYPFLNHHLIKHLPTGSGQLFYSQLKSNLQSFKTQQIRIPRVLTFQTSPKTLKTVNNLPTYITNSAQLFTVTLPKTLRTQFFFSTRNFCLLRFKSAQKSLLQTYMSHFVGLRRVYAQLLHTSLQIAPSVACMLRRESSLLRTLGSVDFADPAPYFVLRFV